MLLAINLYPEVAPERLLGECGESQIKHEKNREKSPESIMEIEGETSLGEDAMEANTRDLQELLQALENTAQPIRVESGGAVMHRIERLLGVDAKRKIKLVDSLLVQLQQLESVPVRCARSGESTEQCGHHLLLLRAAQVMERELTRCRSYPAVRQHRLLKRALVALQYRLEKANGGLSPSTAAYSQVAELAVSAIHWKKAQELIDDTRLSGGDHELLAETAAYPEFVALLKDDRDLRDSFFVWTLRDRLSVSVFVQYPALQQKLVDCALHGRISRVGPQHLRIQLRDLAAGIAEKVVTLPFEGQEISLLDESASITLRGNYILTIKDVFEIFKNKEKAIGNLEFLHNGVTNWNAHLLAWWDADSRTHRTIDLSSGGWWQQLPATEVLTREQASERYGVSLDGVQWNIAACATRSRRTLAPIGSHAFFEIAIPMADARYTVFSFGKFALRWATTAWENLVAFTDNHDATIAYPDENIFFTNRQHARRSFVVSPGVGMSVMESIKQDMLNAQSGTLIYQWEGDNCAKWVQDILEQKMDHGKVPDLRVPMLYSEPSDPSRHLFAVLRQLPETLHSPVLSFLHYPLGAWRGKWIVREGKKVWRSLTNSHFWDKKLVYLPAMIHTQTTSTRETIEAERASVPEPLFAFSYATVTTGAASSLGA